MAEKKIPVRKQVHRTHPFRVKLCEDQNGSDPTIAGAKDVRLFSGVMKTNKAIQI
jgi:hypothetical protein